MVGRVLRRVVEVAAMLRFTRGVTMRRMSALLVVGASRGEVAWRAVNRFVAVVCGAVKFRDVMCGAA